MVLPVSWTERPPALTESYHQVRLLCLTKEEGKLVCRLEGR